MQEHQAVLDVTQAKAMDFDAFALNVISTDAWSMNALSYIFQAAAAIGFHLFFSFDMTHFTDPSQFIPLLKMYIGSPAYYHYNGLPFVSTCRQSSFHSKLAFIYFLRLTIRRYILGKHSDIRSIISPKRLANQL
jgi:hypothetical protein